VSRTRQVALLRGINLAGRRKVPMARLRELLDELGYEEVRTHLQSGNAVLTSSTIPKQTALAIEERLVQEFGFEVAVLVRTGSELAGVIKANPFRKVASNPSRLFVTFLCAKAAAKQLQAIDPTDFEPDLFEARGREIYIWCPNGYHGTKLGHAFWEQQLGLTATVRNWNTVTKLVELAQGR
jgi:uncharacterized protein (DUF1697 family)